MRVRVRKSERDLNVFVREKKFESCLFEMSEFFDSTVANFEPFCFFFCFYFLKGNIQNKKSLLKMLLSGA